MAGTALAAGSTRMNWTASLGVVAASGRRSHVMGSARSFPLTATKEVPKVDHGQLQVGVDNRAEAIGVVEVDSPVSKVPEYLDIHGNGGTV